MVSVDTKSKQLPYKKDNADEKLAIVKEHAPLVKKIAGRFGIRLPPDIDMEDLYQVGMIGLLESIDRYDPTKNANFKTFAEYRIRGAMLDELRARDWIPRSVRTNASRLDKTFTELRKKGIETPNHQDIANQMEMSLDEFNEFLTRNMSIPLVSFDSLFRNNEGSSSGSETVSNPDEINPEEYLLSDEVNEKLATAIKKLPERDQLILALSFKEELNLKEIAKVLDITEARVCQIRTRLIGYLRSSFKE